MSNHPRKPIPQFYSNARNLTAREVALAKASHPRASRNWIIFRDDMNRVMIGRPSGIRQYEVFRAKELD